MPDTPAPNGASTGGVAAGIVECLARGELFSSACPSRGVLKHVTSRWGVLVLVALMAGTLRFSDLRRKIDGVSERMLAQTLDWLEADGFVDRRAYPVVPPHVEYTLTPMGREVAVLVAGLGDWIGENPGRGLRAHPDAATKRAAAAVGRGKGTT
jgi:DNA-binding HxlR family transcriptional regulator